MSLLSELYKIYLKCENSLDGFRLTNVEIEEIIQLTNLSKKEKYIKSRKYKEKKLIGKLERILCSIELPDRGSYVNANRRSSSILNLTYLARTFDNVELEQKYINLGIKHVRDYELNELELVFARKDHAGIIFRERNSKSIKEVSRVLEKCRLKTNAIIELEKIRMDIISRFLESQSIDEINDRGEFRRKLDFVKNCRLQYPDADVIMTSFTTEFMIYEISNSFPENNNVLHEIENAFSSRRQKFSVRKFIVLNRYIRLCIVHNKIQEGLKLINSQFYESLSNNSTTGYYNFSVKIVLKSYLLLHNSEFDLSKKSLKLVVTNSRFKKLARNLREIIEIAHAYTHFLCFYKAIKMPPNSGEKDSFRVYRFMNSITAYSKDKRGMNIAVRIIYALFLLKLRKLGKFVDEMEALGKYNQRYLKGKVTHRPYYFIKLLTIIPKAHFNAVAARRKGQKYFNKLASVSLAESRLPFEIEIYPYEDLWEVVLEILGQKKTHYRSR